ncbi:MAG: hypothetical protein DRH70_02110 [Candidatus Coatesbacteria bacterium]|nr:MAG: hypothetical protein DRH70_02110 [Candidatus Coatesbacteria bacterium]HDM59781.1 hypothetical protein [Bacillota bacterium]
MGKDFRLPNLSDFTRISLVFIAICLLAVPFACSRRDSGSDKSPTGPSAPYMLSITAKPSELYPYENTLVMVDVKDGYGKDLDAPVVVNVTTTGGFFENGENRISGEVLDNASFWLTYDPDHSPNPDFPGTKTVTAIIDYGCQNSYVMDTTDVIFMSQGNRVGSISVTADPTYITDADNNFSLITATVVGEHGAPLSGVTVYFSMQGGVSSSFDASSVDTNALGVAQTVFRPNGDVGVLKVCAQAGTKTACVDIHSEKATTTR